MGGGGGRGRRGFRGRRGRSQGPPISREEFFITRSYHVIGSTIRRGEIFSLDAFTQVPFGRVFFLKCDLVTSNIGRSSTRSWTSTWHKAPTRRLHSTRIWTRIWRRPSELIFGVSDQEKESVSIQISGAMNQIQISSRVLISICLSSLGLRD